MPKLSQAVLVVALGEHLNADRFGPNGGHGQVACIEKTVRILGAMPRWMRRGRLITSDAMNAISHTPPAFCAANAPLPAMAGHGAPSTAFRRLPRLWQWSVTHLEDFWQSVWDYLDLQSPTPHSVVLERNVMPGARWFVGAQVNYAQQVLRHVDAAHAAGMPAIISNNERGQRRELSWPELKRQVAALALHLQAQGVQPGDRVAAYLPNIP